MPIALINDHPAGPDLFKSCGAWPFACERSFVCDRVYACRFSSGTLTSFGPAAAAMICDTCMRYSVAIVRCSLSIESAWVRKRPRHFEPSAISRIADHFIIGAPTLKSGEGAGGMTGTAWDTFIPNKLKEMGANSVCIRSRRPSSTWQDVSPCLL